MNKELFFMLCNFEVNIQYPKTISLHTAVLSAKRQDRDFEFF